VKRLNKLGVGTDIENIDRFEDLPTDDDNRFLSRIFTNNELRYCFSKAYVAPHLAVRFAAKEAVVKALYALGKKNVDYKKVEITLNENRVPQVTLNDDFLGDVDVQISLSHCDDKAVAFAIALNGDIMGLDCLY